MDTKTFIPIGNIFVSGKDNNNFKNDFPPTNKKSSYKKYCHANSLNYCQLNLPLVNQLLLLTATTSLACRRARLSSGWFLSKLLSIYARAPVSALRSFPHLHVHLISEKKDKAQWKIVRISIADKWQVIGNENFVLRRQNIDCARVCDINLKIAN